ncbi:MAG: hypothetical protein ACT4OO_10045 [Nitrospiraceae bacterium]
MKPYRSLLSTLVFLGLAACATRPLLPFQRLAVQPIAPLTNLKPLDPHSAAVGISIKNTQWSQSPDNRIYFVRVEKEEDFYSWTLIPGAVQFSDGKPDYATAYLLNVQPGRYAVVAYTQTASSMVGTGKDVSVFLLSEELIRRSHTIVEPGRITFMGKYELTSPTIVRHPGDVDAAQAHYFLVLWGKPLQQVLSDLALMGTFTSFGCLTQGLVRADRQKQTVRHFLQASLKELDQRWASIIKTSQDDLDLRQ